MSSPAPKMSTVVTLAESDRFPFWKSIKSFYDGDLFCDLVLVCRGGLSLMCHRLVLGGVSPKLAALLDAASETTEESFTTVHLPDLGYGAVRHCVDFLYGILAMDLPANANFSLRPDVVDTLGLDLSKLNLPAAPADNTVDLTAENSEEEDLSPPPRETKQEPTFKKPHPIPVYLSEAEIKRKELLQAAEAEIASKHAQRAMGAAEKRKQAAEEDGASGKRARMEAGDKENSSATVADDIEITETKIEEIGEGEKSKGTQAGTIKTKVIRTLSTLAASGTTTTMTASTAAGTSTGLASPSWGRKVKVSPGAKLTTAIIRTADGQEKKVILAVKNPETVTKPETVKKPIVTSPKKRGRPPKEKPTPGPSSGAGSTADKSPASSPEKDGEKKAAPPPKPPKPLKLKKRNVKCDHCSEKFENWGQLKEHVAKDHPKKSLWGHACEHCGRLFAIKEDMSLHVMQMHNVDGPYKCLEKGCKASYLREASLVRHRKKHHGPGSKSWHPRGKGMSGIAADTPERKKFLANRPSTLKNTKKIVDPETYDVTGYQCTVCDKVTAKYQTHHLHLKEHERVICKICHRTFQGLSNLMKHRTAEHPENIPCDQCGKTFSTSASLSIHIRRVHTPNHEKPIECEECDRRFATKADQENHRIQAHVKNRPFACRFGCGAAYNDLGSRHGHEKKKHGQTYKQAQAKALEEETRSAVASIQQQPPQVFAPAPAPAPPARARTRGGKKKQQKEQQQQQVLQQQQHFQPGQMIQQQMADGTVVFHYPVGAAPAQANNYMYGNY